MMHGETVLYECTCLVATVERVTQSSVALHVYLNSVYQHCHNKQFILVEVITGISK